VQQRSLHKAAVVKVVEEGVTGEVKAVNTGGEAVVDVGKVVDVVVAAETIRIDPVGTSRVRSRLMVQTLDLEVLKVL